MPCAIFWHISRNASFADGSGSPSCPVRRGRSRAFLQPSEYTALLGLIFFQPYTLLTTSDLNTTDYSDRLHRLSG